MKIGVRPILVMHASEPLRDRLRALTGTEFTFQPVAGWAALAEAARVAPPSAVAVVDPFAAEPHAAPADALRWLASEFPSLPVFAAAEATPGWDTFRDRLLAIGAAGVIEIGHDDTPAALREQFRGVRARALRQLLARVLPPDMPGRAEAILDAAADVVSDGGYGRDVAGALRTSTRTLLKWLYRSELPCARQLLAWIRVLQAAELLDDPGRTVLAVARACGYSTDAGLRRVTTRFVGLNPSQLRRRGAFKAASRAFLAALEQRTPGRVTRAPTGASHATGRWHPNTRRQAAACS